MEELEGQIERVTYRSEETDFTVARVAVKNMREPVTVVGQIASPTPGETLSMTGEWITHPHFGRQFKIHSSRSAPPASASGIEKYLASGLVKGIGPVMAGRMIGCFGADTLEIIEHHPERLLEVEGLGAKRLDMIRQAWHEQKAVRRVMLFLQDHGVGTAHAVRIYKQYGDRAIDIVRDDPYRLAQDIVGIGFPSADRIAQNLGFDRQSPRRVRAGVLHLLGEAASDGHVFFPYTPLLDKCAELLQVDRTLAAEAAAFLASDGRIVIEDTGGAIEDFQKNQKAVYLKAFWRAERETAERLLGLSRTRPSPMPFSWDQALLKIHEKLKMQPAALQLDAIRTAATNKVTVITGGPGTGKTTIVRAVLAIFRLARRRVLMAAPTGRAAKRLAETTGGEARTIHRLLEYNPQKGGFEKDESHPLDCDLLIIDEASMIDLPLMHALLLAVPAEAGLVLVGDADQLPSVGPGNLLHDIIQSGALPVIRLTEIFRQASESAIVVNAHRINRGEPPVLRPSGDELDDFYFIERPDPQKALETIIELVAKRIPGRFHLDPAEDIQVLSPMHRGLLGAASLNEHLQAALNPGKEGLTRAGFRFSPGDKVMQVRNNYDKDVFNGDIGRIETVNSEERSVEIGFDGRTIYYDLSEMDEIMPAYAISVHKSQGSEYPAVVMPLSTQHYVMLQRNLLYTAITRGRKLVVIVGEKKAFSIAVNNNRTRLRHTRLADLLADSSRAPV